MLPPIYNFAHGIHARIHPRFSPNLLSTKSRITQVLLAHEIHTGIHPRFSPDLLGANQKQDDVKFSNF
eukprot:1155298-Ditylum_brightwellii.AAC.1